MNSEHPVAHLLGPVAWLSAFSTNEASAQSASGPGTQMRTASGSEDVTGSSLSEGNAAFDVGSLIRAIRHGDERAFAEFYERYCDRLHRLLLGWTRGDEHTARDVLQTVMIKLAAKLPPLATEPELWAWLVRVTRNVLVDYLRRSARPATHGDPNLLLVAEHENETTSPDERLTWLEEAVQCLSSEDQRILREFYFEGHSTRQLAEAALKTPKAIESKLARLRKELRHILQTRIRHEETGL